MSGRHGAGRATKDTRMLVMTLLSVRPVTAGVFWIL